MVMYALRWHSGFDGQRSVSYDIQINYCWKIK